MNETETTHPAVTTTSETLVAAEQDKRRKIMMASTLLLFMVAILVILFVIQSQLHRSAKADPATLQPLQAELEQMRSQLSAQRVSLGLPPLDPPRDSLERISSNLRENVNALIQQAERYSSGEIAKELTAAQSDLALAQQQRETLEATITRQESEINRLRTDNADTARLRREMIGLAAERETFAKQLAEAQTSLAGYAGSASADEIADLERRLEETTRAKEFFEQQAMETTSSLALPHLQIKTVATDLLPEAQVLIRQVQELEGQPDTHLPDAYANFALELGASAIGSISLGDDLAFSAQDEELLEQALSGSGANDLLLVIGYAPESSDLAEAQAIASQQANPVAARLAANKQPAQQVEAYAFGPTARFAPSQPNQNRRSEIWRIKRP